MEAFPCSYNILYISSCLRYLLSITAIFPGFLFILKDLSSLIIEVMSKQHDIRNHYRMLEDLGLTVEGAQKD